VNASTEGTISRDLQQLARACHVLMRLAGFGSEAYWTDRGPTKRASWLKGYLRRAPSRRGTSLSDGHTTVSWRGRTPSEQDLSRPEKIVLLVAFDVWNGSGGVAFGDVLNLPAPLVTAIAALMVAHGAESSEPLVEWIGRFSADVRR
jgi:hypothetical protein